MALEANTSLIQRGRTATLARLLGDLDVAEEAIYEAFAVALDTWPQASMRG